MSAIRRAVPLLAAGLLVAGVTATAVPVAAATKPTLRVNDATLTEGTGGQVLIAFSVVLSAKAPSNVSFTWTTKDGTAKAGSDYTAVAAGAGQILKRETSTVLVVRVAADAVDEYTETFGVHLAGVSSAVTVADADATATILDDDAPPLVTLTPPQVVEGTDTAPVDRPVTVTLSQPSGKPVSVRWALTSGIAEIGTDLEPGSGALSFAPGQTSQTFMVDPVPDDVDEPNRAFAVAWAAPVNVRVTARRTPVTLLDDDGPLRPSILGTTPVGPSPEAAPLVYGLAPAGSTVEVYRNGSCNGSPVASGPAEDFTGAGLVVPMAHNATNTLTVKGTNTVGGDDTACSPAFTYVHDDIAPDAPDNLTTSPASPTNDSDVTLFGSAEAGSTVRVFLDTSCAGTPIATLSAAAFRNTGVPLDGLLSANTTHTLRADATDAAGNTSTCSAPLSVLVDTQAPPAPTGLQVVSGAPQGTAVVVGGTAESGSQVRLFVDNPCTAGSNDGAGTAAAFAGAGITVSHTLSEDDHTIYAQATDPAGNEGPCSSGLDVTVDRTGPGAPDDLELVGDALTDDPQPGLRGTATLDTSTVEVYSNAANGGSACDDLVGSGTRAQFVNSSGISVGPLDDGTYELHARGIDGVGNVGGCSASSVTVTVDTTAPAAPAGLDVVGGTPTSDATPVITGDAAGGTQIHLWVDDPTCGGTADATGTDLDLESGGIELADPLNDGDHVVTATATDPAGNESDCSDPVTVTVDTTPPAVPVLATVDYATSPTVSGSAAGATVVHVYLNTSCTGAPLVSGSRVDFVGAGLPLGALGSGTYDLSATSEDDVGNVSDCSAAISFDVP